jgi:hypothetical protein
MAASYPVSIKSFLTYQDQPGNTNKIVPDPDKPPPATVDLTIDRAKATDEIHDEVIAMEKTVGTGYKNTFIPGTRSMGAEVQAIFNDKANGHVDPANNAIYPIPPWHNHGHRELSGNDKDVHPQYMRVDATRGFSAPVSGQWATAGNHLVPLNQIKSAGWLTYPQVEFVIYTTVAGSSAHPMVGPDPQRYRMTGGYFWGRTDSNGMVRIDYSAAQFRGVLTFVFMKMPFPGPSAYGYTYQYEEDQLILIEIDNNGSWIQFSEDIVVDRQAWVSMTWMVVGV